MEEAVRTIGDSLVSIDTSRTDDADGRLLLFHHTGLYGWGMCAKQYIGVVLDEEGVLHVTGGMILGEVQGGEDVPIVLDLRSLSDAES